MKSIRVHGGGFDKYDNVRLGLNGRLDTIQATILLEKLSLFPVEIELRNKVAKYYSDNIPNYLHKPSVPEGFKSVWAQYSLLSESKEQRDSLISYLKEKEIPAMIYYRIPLHLQKVFSDLGYSKGDFPISEDISDRVFSIPMHPYLEKNDQDKIIEALISFKK